ncbi:MAG: peroxiredoxin [Hyphomicrobiaceae bacterium]
MTIAVGERLPDQTFKIMKGGQPADVRTSAIFAGRTVALFAVPGAYTPTCHLKHLPGFLANVDAFKQKGVDEVACTSVNDIFVLTQWAKDTGSDGRILMLADGGGAFAKAIGMDLDLGAFGLGLRSKRYAMLVKDGVVAALNIEENAGVADVSSAERLLEAL